MILNNFRYFVFALRNFSNPFVIFPLLFTSSQQRNFIVKLKNGIQIYLRSCTRKSVCDLDILQENLQQDQYDLANIISKGDTIVDIGAHIGIFSIMAAMHSVSGQIISFEPEKSNFDLLVKNVSLNPGIYFRVFNKAITSRGDNVKLAVASNNKGGHTLLVKSNEYQEVPSITLSRILDIVGNGNINLLKIDCEGSEYDILLNASSEDFMRIDKIIMEVHETQYTGNYTADHLHSHLQTHGFTIKVLKTIVYKGEGVFYIVYVSR